MAKSTISIGFKIEDAEGGFKKLTVDAGELRKVMQQNVVAAGELRSNLINFVSVATGLSALSALFALFALLAIVGFLLYAPRPGVRSHKPPTTNHLALGCNQKIK